ncbi:hypothetical protein [Streptomyces griseoluteus]
MVSSKNFSRRDDLLLMLLHGGAASNAIATHVVDAFRVENLHEAIEAARSEYLTVATGDETDDAYNRGVADAIAAIDALINGGAR